MALASAVKAALVVGAAWGLGDGSCEGDQCFGEESALLQSKLAARGKVDSSHLAATQAALDVVRQAACRQWALDGNDAELKKNCKVDEVEIHDHSGSYHDYNGGYKGYNYGGHGGLDTPQPSWPEGCKGYCEYFVPACSAPNNPIGRYYKDMDECLAKCATIPVTQNEIQQGNTMACRAFHAALSQSTTAQTAFHCNHAYFEDPMHICRNADLPGYGRDMREIVFRNFGPYPMGSSLLETDVEVEVDEAADEAADEAPEEARKYGGSYPICKSCSCNKDSTVVSCQGRGLSQLQFVKLMENLPGGLRVLDLSKNNITHLPEKVFESVPGLLGLDLANNDISSINRKAFRGLRKLASLLLDYNANLASLPAGMLSDQEELVEFSITNCGLTGQAAFPENIFWTTKKLKFASLFGNGALTGIPAGMFKNTPDLFLLSLVVTSQDQSTSSWPLDVLKGLDKLEQLHISLNGPPCTYDAVPQAVVDGLKDMKSLRGFVFWGCDTLTSLPPKLFEGNPNLEVVYLFNGGITKFDEDLLSATNGNLKILGVESNNITTDCAYAAGNAALYPTSTGWATGTALADEVGFVCDVACKDVCPMVRTAKEQNPGAYVTFGNFIAQSGDPRRR